MYEVNHHKINTCANITCVDQVRPQKLSSGPRSVISHLLIMKLTTLFTALPKVYSFTDN